MLDTTCIFCGHEIVPVERMENGELIKRVDCPECGDAYEWWAWKDQYPDCKTYFDVLLKLGRAGVEWTGQES